MNQSPAWLPGPVLVYLSDRDGPTDLYARRISTNGQGLGPDIRFTTGLGAAAFATSADGSSLAFASNRVTANIWSLPIPDHGPVGMDGATQVTSGGQMVESISISDDGGWLVYDSDRSGNSDAYRMRLPDGPPEQLTSSDRNEYSPDISPDGRDLVYHAWQDTSREVYLQPLDGGRIRALTATPTQEVRARWSHGGDQLTWFDVSAPGGVWVARRASDGSWTSRRRLDSGYWAAWSPDDRFLSFSTSTSGGRPMIMPSDSGEPRDLLPGKAWPIVTTSGWSRDGRTIYWHRFAGHSGNMGVSKGRWHVASAGSTDSPGADRGAAHVRGVGRSLPCRALGPPERHLADAASAGALRLSPPASARPPRNARNPPRHTSRAPRLPRSRCRQ